MAHRSATPDVPTTSYKEVVIMFWLIKTIKHSVAQLQFNILSLRFMILQQNSRNPELKTFLYDLNESRVNKDVAAF